MSGTEMLVEALRAGLAYSHNHATASPFIRAVDKEHILGLCALVERAIEALASHTEQPSAQAGEVVGFRFRIKGSADKWTYTTHRSPDSFELRECEIQNIFAATQPPASAGEVIDLDVDAWSSVKKAANASKWMPPEYCMNDWLADICEFLRNGPPASARITREAWQPIETAPKDQTNILLWGAGFSEALPGAYYEWFDSIRDIACEGWREFGFGDRIYKPTHWMPLPKLPSSLGLTVESGE